MVKENKNKLNELIESYTNLNNDITNLVYNNLGMYSPENFTSNLLVEFLNKNLSWKLMIENYKLCFPSDIEIIKLMELKEVDTINLALNNLNTIYSELTGIELLNQYE